MHCCLMQIDMHTLLPEEVRADRYIVHLSCGKAKDMRKHTMRASRNVFMFYV